MRNSRRKDSAFKNGRILDREGLILKTVFSDVCREYQSGSHLVPHQSVPFTDVEPEDRAWIEEILRRQGVKLPDKMSNVRRWSMTCVGPPTCPLAITGSERVFPGLIGQLEVALARLGLAGERFTVRMTGCPNGCARPYNADVGLSGRAAGRYANYLDGRLLSDRMAFLYRDLVPLTEIIPLLKVLLTCFKHQRQSNETFRANSGQTSLSFAC